MTGTIKHDLGSKMLVGRDERILLIGSIRVPLINFLNLEHQLDTRLPGTRKTMKNTQTEYTITGKGLTPRKVVGISYRDAMANWAGEFQAEMDDGDAWQGVVSCSDGRTSFAFDVQIIVPERETTIIIALKDVE